MAAKAFFRQNPTTLVWEYGDFKSDGITPNIESTITHARARWETINSVECLTLRHSEDNGIFQPFDNIPITDVASDKEGTPYVSRAAFETATKDFFFRVGGLLGSSGYISYLIPAEQITGTENTFVLPFAINTNKPILAVRSNVVYTPNQGITSVTVSGGATTVVFDEDIADGIVEILYVPSSLEDVVIGTVRIVTESGNILASDRKNRIIVDSANPVVLTVPTGLGWSSSDYCEIFREGAGTVTIAEASGTTIHSVDEMREIYARYAPVSLIGFATNSYRLIGGLK